MELEVEIEVDIEIEMEIEIAICVRESIACHTNNKQTKNKLTSFLRRLDFCLPLVPVRLALAFAALRSASRRSCCCIASLRLRKLSSKPDRHAAMAPSMYLSFEVMVLLAVAV